MIGRRRLPAPAPLRASGARARPREFVNKIGGDDLEKGDGGCERGDDEEPGSARRERPGLRGRGPCVDDNVFAYRLAPGSGTPLPGTGGGSGSAGAGGTGGTSATGGAGVV